MRKLADCDTAGNIRNSVCKKAVERIGVAADASSG